MERSRYLGIYIGKDAVSISEVDSRKLRGTIVLDFASLAKKNPVAELDELVGLETLVRKGIKDISATTTETYVSISDGNVFFRVIELPLMNKAEIAASLHYEASNHIPFKIEDVAYDWKEKRIPKSKKMMVSFVGTRKVLIDNIGKTMDSLGLNVRGIEPSLSSLLRVFTLDRTIAPVLKKVKRYAIFDLSSAEANIIFFEDIPLFSRGIKVTLNENTASPDALDYGKLKEELFMSFNFYNREFRDKPLESVLVFCEDMHKESVLSIKNDFAVPFEVISLSQLLPGEGITSLKGLKSYSVALKEAVAVPFNVNLLAEKEGASARAETGVTTQTYEGSPRLNVRLLMAAAVLGIAIIGGALLYTQQQRALGTATLAGKELLSKESVKELQTKQVAIVKTIKEIKNRLTSMQKKRKISSVFGDIPGLLTDGMWLTNLSLNKDVNRDRYTLEVIGKVYLGDPDKEAGSLDEFIDRLKRLKGQYVLSEVKIIYKERKPEVKGEEVLAFQIRGIGE